MVMKFILNYTNKELQVDKIIREYERMLSDAKSDEDRELIESSISDREQELKDEPTLQVSER